MSTRARNNKTTMFKRERERATDSSLASSSHLARPPAFCKGAPYRERQIGEEFLSVSLEPNTAHLVPPLSLSLLVLVLLFSRSVQVQELAKKHNDARREKAERERRGGENSLELRRQICVGRALAHNCVALVCTRLPP